MNIKRLSAMLIAAAILLAMGCACSTESDTPSASQPSASQPAVSETPAVSNEPNDVTPSKSMYPISEEPITLTGWAVVVDAVLSLAGGEFDTLTNVQEASRATNVNVDWSVVGIVAGSEQFNIMVASGSLTDILSVPLRWYPSGAYGLLDDEVCIDLIPYLEEYAPDYYDMYLSDRAYAKYNTTDDGRLVQMSSNQGYITSSGTMIRGDWLEDLGLSVPSTYDELTNVLTAFAREKDTKNTVALVRNGTFGTSASGAGWLTGGYGVPQTTNFGDLPWHVGADGKVVMSFTDQGYYEYFSMIADWYDRGIFTDDILNLESNGQYEAQLLNGETGFGAFGTGMMSNAFASSSADPDRFQFVPMADVTKTGTETINMGGLRELTAASGFGVSAQCGQPEIAVMYLNWYWSEEGEFISNFGIQGIAHEYDEDGNMYFTDLVLNHPSGQSYRMASQVYCGYLQSGFNILPETVYMQCDNDIQKSAPDIWASNRTEDGVYHGNMTVSEQAIYNKPLADMVTYMNECVSSYIIGARSLDEYWDDIEQLYQMGLQDMIDVKQAAYDRYIS